MGKSKAEIQRAYRQRLKAKNNEEYLRRERERVRRNYVPSSELSERDRKRRNENNRAKLRKFYQRKREERQNQMSPREQDTSGYESGLNESYERGRLRLRLPFQSNRRKGALLRWKRELSEATSRIRLLEQERVKLMKRYKSTQRSLQRIKKNSTEKNTSRKQELTPRKQTEQEMQKANLTESQKQNIRKSLLLGNVIVSEIKQTKDKTPKGTIKALHRIVSGKITKKYKCIKLLSLKTGLCRHALGKSTSKLHQVPRSSRKSTVGKYQEKVVEFMKREDNSKLQPGKKDVKKSESGDKRQVYILTDYLSNLHKKFLSENPDVEISFTSFSRCRPNYILTTSFSSRSSCLCTKHQNAALSVKLLRKEGVDVSANPETAIGNFPSEDDLKKSLPESIAWSQWNRIEIEEKGKKKMVTRVTESKLDRDQFLIKLEQQMKEFESHVKRVAKQYEEIKILKQNLPRHEMLIQLDFAENYSCRSMEEVQSAYFNQTSVTLHPVVAYFRGPDDALKHQSIMIVSDEMGHKASTVITFIDELQPILKAIDPELTRVHYWSDSPTSQYRNKHIFDLVSNHEQRYGTHARWNYFEAGHGKGPCDGLGGSCKRLADEAMRSGKATIQDATDFYKWAINSSMKNVQFKFVSSEKCKDTEVRLQSHPVKAVKGTMKIHAVVGQGDSRIKTRVVSCYCSECLAGGACDDWDNETTANHGVPNSKTANTVCTEEKKTDAEESRGSEQASNEHEEINTESIEMKYAVDDHVAAVYEDNWFIGKIVDQDEDEYEVQFMETKKQFFQWPRNDDIVWRKPGEILTKVDEPEATGKSKRMFKISEIERERILSLYAVYSEKQ